jgi:outer membrane protein assembly factor BamB
MRKIGGVLFTLALPFAAVAAAQAPTPPAAPAPIAPSGPTVGSTTTANEWTTWGYDEERTAWNRGEKTLSKSNVANLRLHWSTKVSTPRQDVVLSTLTAPLVAAGVQTPNGARDVVYTLGADDTLFAIDVATGKEIWHKAMPNPIQPKKAATWLCSNTANVTPVIDKARGLIFVVPSDGKLRALNLGTGEDRMTPTEMILPFARFWSLNLIDNIVYTAGGRACGEIQDPRSIWASAAIPIQRRPGSDIVPVQTDPSAVVAIDTLDLTKPTASHFFTSGGRPAGPWGRGGVVRGPGNSVIFMTSDGIFDSGSGSWTDSVLKLSPKAARLQDSFTPDDKVYVASKDLAGSASPVVFPFAGKTLIAAIQKQGVLYLLDANDMGGKIAGKHEKYVFKSSQLGNDAALGTDPGQGVWGATSTYLTPSGKRFIYMPMHGPNSTKAPVFPVNAGMPTTGSIMAFEVVEKNGAIVAEPRWQSENMIMPDPPTLANGVLFATSTGGQAIQNPTVNGARLSSATAESATRRSTPVGNLTLYAYDAETGKRLYTSGKTITNWVHFSEPVVALGKVFLVTNDSQVIAFGLGAPRAR